ncbi:hypothetical protein SORBI_3004G349150 [Sorghum bicolor]|uniref:Uncharacterized protein n=3 Tax=Sorghum bicolor TaxID=4558 RepID=A0A1Z5RQC1_SORBI|nr:hypothetical protein SORBI_3004G349150 [Sorghum bicolor]
MLTTNGSVTTTTTSPIMSAAAAAAAAASEKWEMYYCFLCTGRHPLLIHRCPIYWDECHINCWDAIPDDPSSSAPPAPPVGSSSSAPAPGKDCYVMKLYNSGRYVIVQHLNCDYVATYACFLTCGGGELVADHQKAAGAMATTTTVQQGSLLPFELCNTQLLVNALRAPPSAGVDVVTAAHGGAH